MSLRDLARLSHAELESIHRAGEPPDLSNLVGREYCGWNRPAHFSALGIRKFVKGFFAPGEGESSTADREVAVEGFNIPAIQNGLDGEWLAPSSDDSPRRFGFYAVGPAPTIGPGARHANAVFLDYGSSPRNPWWDPSRVIRDFLVRVEPGSDEILLGRAHLAIAPGLWVFSNFFLLEFRRRHTFRG